MRRDEESRGDEHERREDPELGEGETVAVGGAGAVVGTPAFASPEQLRDEELDIRSDIYSLGATLHYLLTGRAPFEAANLVSLMSRSSRTSPTRLGISGLRFRKGWMDAPRCWTFRHLAGREESPQRARTSPVTETGPTS